MGKRGESLFGMADVRVLDCTLRDGGFNTEWTFSPELVRELVGGLDEAGVDIIEVGYRSPDRGRRSGVFKYCDENVLADYLPPIRRAQLAFMIDAKDVLRDQQVDTGMLAHMVRPRAESCFTWARVASHFDTM